MKGVVEALGRALGVELEYEPAVVPYLVEGRTAAVSVREGGPQATGLGHQNPWLPPSGGRSA